ncbi:hypothetical protein ACROYT_G020848 [Oculina patagonica]
MAANFELGSCKLLRSNINYLHQSLQIFGKNVENVQSGELVWTDGESVWLSSVNFRSNYRETTCIGKERCLVGEFGSFVLGVSCSELTKGSSGYYIAVVLKEKVVVLWRKIGEAVVKLVKEYFTDCLPQGCVWHPAVPLLAVLSKTSAVLLRFSEEFECDVISIQTSYRNLKTCEWSKDGKSLAISVEDSLCIFSWIDLNKPNNFTFVQWNSLKLTGKINCIVPWKSSSFIIATEQPLDTLCGNSEFENDGDVFDIKNTQDSCEESKEEKSSSSVVNVENIDFTMLTPSANQDINSLLKLKLRTPQFEASTAMAQIIAMCCEDAEPREIGRSSIKGLISPDLLFFQPASSTVVVGSHCCSRLHCYTLHQSSMSGKTEFVTKEKLLELDPDTKPKGICLIPGNTDSFLALLGKPKDVSNMAAFPPSAIYLQYEVSLRCFSSLLKDNHTTSMDKFDQQQSNNQTFNHEDATTNTGGIAACTVVTNSEQLPSLRLPNGSVFKGCVEAVERQKTSLISELQISNNNYEVPELLGDSKDSFHGAQSSWFKHIQDVKATMTTSVSQINERLSKLNKRIDEVESKQAAESKHNLYPLPENAEFVCVVWTDELTGAVEQENFLLDKGRLKLKTIEQAFSASLVRICIGDVPCIVSSGEGGFIPVRFLSGSTVQMSGHSKLNT